MMEFRVGDRVEVAKKRKRGDVSINSYFGGTVTKEFDGTFVTIDWDTGKKDSQWYPDSLELSSPTIESFEIGDRVTSSSGQHGSVIAHNTIRVKWDSTGTTVCYPKTLERYVAKVVLYEARYNYCWCPECGNKSYTAADARPDEKKCSNCDVVFGIRS